MEKLMFKNITPYVCPSCGSDTLFFTTRHKTLIDYKSMMQKEKMTLYDIKKHLETKNIRYVKCIGCNTTYIIDWRNGYPVPLTDKNYLSKFGL